MEKTTRLKFSILAILFAVGLALSPAITHAATLYFSPSSGTHAVGATLSVSIYVSSADQTMNAASGVISFPRDKLEVASLSKTGSIFSLWVQEPSFSNSAGTINFEGIVLNPGFIGSSGKAITITFRTKAAGNAPLIFSSGSVLANDGQGTNILTSLGNAQFSLGGAAPTIPETTISGAPSTSQVSSDTHPDSNKWYSDKNPVFSWPLPTNTTAVRLLFGKIPNAVPVVNYSPPITSKKIENLDDGIWYFHAQFRNSAGWGDITHFRVQIDSEPPAPFVIKFIDGKETDDPRPIILFNTTDLLSGIDYYKIKIGEGDFFVLPPDIVENNPYVLSLQAPGKKTILVQAYDKAGNYTTASEEFIIKPIRSPEITDYPREIESGEMLKISGKTYYPKGQISIWLQREKEDPKQYFVKSDENGNFVFIAEEKTKDGVYKLWAEVIDERGARSVPASTITITVKKQSMFFKIGSWAVNLLTIVIPLIALIVLLIIVLLRGWYKLSLFRKHVRKETREAESALHKAFDLLKENIREQIKMLEKTRTKRQLTEEEEKIINQLRKDLDDAEKFVRKEIEDIEKAVK